MEPLTSSFESELETSHVSFYSSQRFKRTLLTHKVSPTDRISHLSYILDVR